MKTYKYRIGKKIISNDYLDPEELSNTTFFPLIPALKKGFRVKSVEVLFSYPELQRRNEEILARSEFLEKRRFQKLSLLVELMYFIS